MLELEVFIQSGSSRDKENPYLVVGTAWAKAQRQTHKTIHSPRFSLTDAAGVPAESSS